MWSWCRRQGRSVSNFAKRHSTALIVTGGAVAIGTYGVYHLYNKAQEFSQQMEEEWTKLSRRRQHLLRSKQECHLAQSRFILAVAKRIDSIEVLNVTEVVSKLRKLPKGESSQKSELWNLLKYRMLSRYFVTLAVYTNLYLLIHVQLHLLGRKAFQRSSDGIQENEAENAAAPHQYLSNGMSYFLNDGLDKLVEHVTTVVEADSELMSEDWSVLNRLSVTQDEWNSLTSRLYSKLIPDFQNESDKNAWTSMLNNCDQVESSLLSSDGKEDLEGLVNETWAIVDSSLFQTVLVKSLNAAHNVTKELQNQNMFTKKTLPLAKIISNLQRHFSCLTSNDDQQFREALDSVEFQDTLCEAIFEQGGGSQNV